MGAGRGLDEGWSWWVAFAVAVAVGLLTGLAVERFFIGRLRRRTSSPITLLLLSLGVSQILLAIAYLPGLGPNESGVQYPQPYRFDLAVGGVVLTGMSVLTLLLVPVLVGGLALFMRYSLLGKQVRAAANNSDAARLCGISIRRVSAVTWAIAGSFSAVSAVLQVVDSYLGTEGAAIDRSGARDVPAAARVSKRDTTQKVPLARSRSRRAT